MGSIVTKSISGKKYIYYSYYDAGKKQEKYCGLASNPTTTKKAILLQIKQLHEQRKSLLQKVKSLEKKLQSKKYDQ